MIRHSSFDMVRDELRKPENAVWLFLLALAVATGAWFRFKGFSVWPMAVDEYYIWRSVIYILDSGLPEYPCGGYYSRGLLYQYTVAPLIAAGMSAEAGLRIVTILSSLAALPAVYLLARSIAPPAMRITVASAAVIILALSAWDIEMARFGRMYAPFQALFAWYLYHSWMLLTRQEPWRWWWLLGLSSLGPLVFEGGFFLAVFNLLAILMAKNLWRASAVVGASAVLAWSYWIVRTPFRYMSEIPELPLGAPGSSAQVNEGGDQGAEAIALLSDTALMWSGAELVVALVAGVVAAVILWRARPGSPLTWLATASVLVAAGLGHVSLAIAMLLGSWLLGWTDSRVLGRKGWPAMIASVLVISIFWALLLLIQKGTLPVGVEFARALAPLYEFPGYVNALILPWGRTIPIVAFMAAAGVVVGIYYVAISDREHSMGVRWLLLVVLVGATLAAIAIGPRDHVETRYSFFLYPVFIVLLLVGVAWAATAIMGARRSLVTLVPLAIVSAFLASEEFNLRHLLTIDSYEANFRVGYDRAVARHYYSRYDHLSPGEYLQDHAVEGDLIMITEAPLQPYLPWLDVVYLAAEDSRFGRQSCRLGTVERWTNAPLIYDGMAARQVLLSHGPGDAWVVVSSSVIRPWQQALVKWIGSPPDFVSKDGAFEVYRVRNGEAN